MQAYLKPISLSRKATISILIGLLLAIATVIGALATYEDIVKNQIPTLPATAIVIVDDGGADDQNGGTQLDANFLIVDYGPPSPPPTEWFIAWGWDDTSFSGSNSVDGCALFDSQADADGNIDYALCVSVEDKAGVTEYTTKAYVCSNKASDKCTEPQVDITTPVSICNVSFSVPIDPFGNATSEYYDPAHVASLCNGTDCVTQDTLASCTASYSDFPNSKLVNVCMFPSGQSNSNPSDCVFAVQSGFLSIYKDAGSDTTTDFVFTSSAPAKDGSSTWTITGSGSEELISFQPGTIDLSEAIPSDWQLDDVYCITPNGSTGTPPGTLPVYSGSAGVTGVTILEGLETKCYFKDSRQKGSLKITKNVTGDVPPSFSQVFTFDVLCTLTGKPDLTFNDLAINYPTATFVTQGNIPTGYSCAVTEDPPTAVTGYTWGAPIYTGNPAVIAMNNTEYTVGVENPISRDRGSLKITKAVTGSVPPSFSQVFTFDVLCTLTGKPDLTFNDLAIDYPTATFVTQGNIPTGYSLRRD